MIDTTDPAPSAQSSSPSVAELSRTIRAALGNRSIILVGMMGAGKSAIGRLLGRALNMDFVDADAEIEKAAGMSIPDMFEAHGEAYFREGEVKVIARLLESGRMVLATGGGAWMNPDTRKRASEHGISVWLNADTETLLKRVRRRSNRPMLNTENPESTFRRLLAERAPVYAQADITVLSCDVPHDMMVRDTLIALASHVSSQTHDPSTI